MPSYMSYHKWSEYQTSVLVKNYQTKTRTELQFLLGLPYSVIENKVKLLKLTKPKPRRFTKEKDETLKRYYSKRTLFQISKMIGIDERAIVRRIWYLRKLKKDPFWATTSMPKNTGPSQRKNRALRKLKSTDL